MSSRLNEPSTQGKTSEISPSVVQPTSWVSGHSRLIRFRTEGKSVSIREVKNTPRPGVRPCSDSLHWAMMSSTALDVAGSLL